MQLIITEGALKGHHVFVVQPVTSQGKTKVFRFLDLPAEIRTMIYGHIFEESGEIRMATYKPPRQPRRSVRWSFHSGQYRSKGHGDLQWDRDQGKWLNQEPSALTVLGVCKLVFQEAAPMVYGSNTFLFHRVLDADVFLGRIGRMRRHLRTIKFQGSAYGMGKITSVFNKLKDAKQLRTITFPHSGVCGAYYHWNAHWLGAPRGYFSARTLCNYLGPLAKTLNKAQNNGQSIYNVLELIQITGREPPCYRCSDGSGVCALKNSTFCKTECNKMDVHVQKFMDECKDRIAKKLGIAVDEGSDEEREDSTGE